MSKNIHKFLSFFNLIKATKSVTKYYDPHVTNRAKKKK